MHYLSFSFNLALSFALVVAELDDSLSNWDPFWIGLLEKSDEEFVPLSKAFQASDQDRYSSDKMDSSFNNLYSNNNQNFDAISAAWGNSDSSSVDLFAAANEEQPNECFPLLSSPSSKVRPRAPGGVCPNSDDSGVDELTLEEQIERLWCSATAVPGFANIPVCKSDGRETADSAMFSDSSEVPLYEPMIALPGTITLEECYLSMSDPRGNSFFASSGLCFMAIFTNNHAWNASNVNEQIYSDAAGCLFL